MAKPILIHVPVGNNPARVRMLIYVKGLENEVCAALAESSLHCTLTKSVLSLQPPEAQPLQQHFLRKMSALTDVLAHLLRSR